MCQHHGKTQAVYLLYDLHMHETMRRLYEAARTLRGANTPSEVSRLLDTTPQVVSNWEKRGISKEGLLTAQEKIGCRAEWVKYGRGFMSSFGLGQDSNATGSAADSYDTVRNDSGIRTQRLPLIRWEQVGQIGVLPVQSLDIVRFMDSPFPSSDGSFLLELASEVMTPDYRPGEIIQVDPMADAGHGHDVVVLLPDGRATFRRLVDGEGGRLLQALNPQWPERLLPFPDGARIVGVVVGSWMNRLR